MIFRGFRRKFVALSNLLPNSFDSVLISNRNWLRLRRCLGWAWHAEGGRVGRSGILMDRGQGGAVAGHSGMVSSGTAVSTDTGQGGQDGQWAMAGPGKALAWWASFKVEA
jgi:hypothetical protein